MNTFARVVVGLVLCLSWSASSWATYPGNCRPSPGATLECTAPYLTPYRYTTFGCTNDPYRASEAESFADLPPWFTTTPSCNRQITRLGWVTSYREIGPNCGPPSYAPGTKWGSEVSNASTYRYEWDDCNTMEHGVSDRDRILRNREHRCPRGYNLAIAGFCYRQWLDPTKNNGKPCPPCGNPINAGTGNKYQEETDYIAAGTFPLTFKRHYNSHLRTTDSHPGLFNYTTHAVGGPTAHTKLFLVSEDNGDRFKVLAMDSVGQNWRHHYQRAIDVATLVDGATTLTTAYAYRPDGRVLVFNLYNGQYVATTDISDRLEQLGGGWKLTSADGDEIELYAPSGQLLSIANRAGLTHTVAYDSNGRIASVSDSFGRSITFVYDVANPVPGDAYIIKKVITPDGGEVTFGYDSSTRLTSVTYPDGKSRAYLYENGTFTRAMTGLIDEANVRFATWGYDAYGRANLSEHASGVNQTTITHAGNLYELQTGTKTVVDALGVSRTYTHSNVLGVAKLTGITQPAASGTGTVTESYTYDVNGNRTSKRDFKNQRTCYVYDLTRNLEMHRVEGFAAGISCPSNLATYTPTAGTRQRKISTQWHPTYRLPTQIDEPGKRTTFTHDANGNVLTKTELDTATSESRTWTYTYNSFGQVLTADGPRTDVSDVTTYTYYTCTTGFQCGQVETITNALGHVTTYNTYNAHGQPLTITDPNGVVTTLTYDLRQRLTSRTVGAEQTTRVLADGAAQEGDAARWQLPRLHL